MRVNMTHDSLTAQIRVYICDVSGNTLAEFPPQGHRVMAADISEGWVEIEDPSVHPWDINAERGDRMRVTWRGIVNWDEVAERIKLAESAQKLKGKGKALPVDQVSLVLHQLGAVDRAFTANDVAQRTAPKGVDYGDYSDRLYVATESREARTKLERQLVERGVRVEPMWNITSGTACVAVCPNRQHPTEADQEAQEVEEAVAMLERERE